MGVYCWVGFKHPGRGVGGVFVRAPLGRLREAYGGESGSIGCP